MPLPHNNSESHAIIDAHGLNFAYQGNFVLNKVSFQIFPGEFVGIIGPNGGGKTTLLKLIMGFLRPTSGSIFIDGKRASTHQSHTTGLAYVPQSIRFDRDFPISVEEVVLSGLLSHLPWYGRFRARERQIARKALEKVHLSNLRDCAFGTLSGGQAQRILIARAIVANPRILILDEPTASVDNQAEADIYSILKELKGCMTILMVTHNLRTALEHVERILCVQREVFALKPEEVCQHLALGLYHKPFSN